MPEKITKSSAIHQDSDEESETSEALDEYEEYEEKNDDDVEESSDDSGEELKDIGELLGFRVTGGKDFFMPITIFHVCMITSSSAIIHKNLSHEKNR